MLPATRGLPPDLLANISVDRFKREIQLAAKLQQAQIVPVLTTGEVGSIPYYTMPFAEASRCGPSLRAPDRWPFQSQVQEVRRKLARLKDAAGR